MPKKPAVGLRKPPAPPVPADAAERFVRGEEAASLPAARRSRAVVRRKGGREVRRATVYLPPDLHRRLAVHAANSDSDVSSVIAELLEAHLPRT
jgi:hypothetical protein